MSDRPTPAECCKFVMKQLHAAGYHAYADRISELLVEYSSLIAEREAVLEEAWNAIDRLIVRSELSGDGCDKTAQRNGLVLAANTLMEMRQK